MLIKSLFSFYIAIVSSQLYLGQNVGIKTTSPTQTLDVNGTLRVRGIIQKGSVASKDSVMVFENSGILKYVTASSIVNQVPAGTVSVNTNDRLVGNGTSSSPLGLASLGAVPNQALGWTGVNWGSINQSSSSNWLFSGNFNTDTTNSLGTNNNIPMRIRSNNAVMLQFGVRNTLGYYDSSNTGLYPYNQANGSMAYIGGTNGLSSLQFENTNALKYKPVFYTDPSGNFGMRGSAAGSDWFEVASGGSSNNGSLNFTIGDDGNEPIVFRKYNGANKSYVEMMRLQGGGLNSNVYAGINMNGTKANSTLQIQGSVSKSIKIVSANSSLGELDYTVLLENPSSSAIAVTLPDSSSCIGRIYVLKRFSNSGSVSISNYFNKQSVSTATLPIGVTQLQSNGSSWQQIN